MVSSKADLYFLINQGDIFFNVRNRLFTFRYTILFSNFYFQIYRNKSTHALIEKGKVYLYNRKWLLNLLDFVAVPMYVQDHNLGFLQEWSEYWMRLKLKLKSKKIMKFICTRASYFQVLTKNKKYKTLHCLKIYMIFLACKQCKINME